ncbi:MAG: hypothetical protein LBJ14_10405 [Desulfarculales bacterium]|jgi:hypothetical protein|nr:hypothetical protein [Desulfarculales bacterium]
MKDYSSGQGPVSAKIKAVISALSDLAGRHNFPSDVYVTLRAARDELRDAADQASDLEKAAINPNSHEWA